MKFGVVIFPGSNCDQDAVYALREIFRQEVVELWHKTHDLQGCDFIILPGGFSYGDYLRSGAIARFSPIMDEVISFAKNGGYVLGICNGFQVLCESHLLPGALLRNEKQNFICKNVFLKTENNTSLITRYIPHGKVLKIPVAHAEGRYYADEKTIESLEENEQVLFRYCDKNGEITREANVNGSINSIAGIMNSSGNVFGMMPHPERAVDSVLKNEDGKYIFNSILETVMV